MAQWNKYDVERPDYDTYVKKLETRSRIDDELAEIARQEESIFEAEQQIELRRNELTDKIDDLHSRITTNTKEIMTAAAQQHQEQNREIAKIREDLSGRIGVMEKWRHIIIGGSIVVGFLVHKLVEFS